MNAHQKRNRLINRKRLSIAITIVLCVIVIAVTYMFYRTRWESINLWANNITKEDPKEFVTLSMSMVEKLTPNIEDFLSGLIALFGIVLSIWVGLNIYSVLGKDELVYLEERSEELSADINAMQDVIQAHKSILATNYETNFSELLSCVERSLPHYGSSRYLMEKFNELLRVEQGEDIDPQLTVLLPEFIRIENFFLAASEAYGSKNFAERKLLSTSGINICNNVITIIREKTLNPFFEGYVHLRIGDFNFYMGHRQAEGRDNLDTAKRELNEAAKKWFGINILDTDPCKSVLTKKSDSELYCLAYLYNIIGESFNVLWQAPISDHDPKLVAMADRYLGFAANNIIPCLEKKPISKYFATYYRNYGTALDHQKNSDCIIWYEKALALNSSDSLSHLDIASWKLKEVQELCDNAGDVQKQEQYVNIALQHLELYRMQHPADPVGYGKSCWAYTLKAIICWKMNEEKVSDEVYNILETAKAFWALSKKSEGNQTDWDSASDINATRIKDFEKKLHGC